MSRAIPANFSEYLLDQTSQNTGIICDGGIMPLRTNTSHTSTWYKKCLRGEDIMFLKEAVAARRNDYSNSGLDNRQIKSNRLQQVRQQIGYLINGGLWSEYDPSSHYGFHNFGSSSPSANALHQYITGLLPSLTQYSANDTYSMLDSESMMNLFRDIKQLNYVILDGGTTYNRYQGYYLASNNTQHTVSVRGHTDGTSTTRTSDTTSSWLWYQNRRLNHIYGEGYPNNESSREATDTTGSSISFTEGSSASYRRYHRYMAVKPFGVFKVFNRYDAAWQNGTGSQAVTGSDSWETTQYILAPFPVTTYIDTLNATSITISNWSTFFPAIYNVAGLQMYADNITGGFHTGSYSDSKQQITYVENPLNVFFVGHFMYCNLEDVAIEDLT